MQILARIEPLSASALFAGNAATRFAQEAKTRPKVAGERELREMTGGAAVSPGGEPQQRTPRNLACTRGPAGGESTARQACVARAKLKGVGGSSKGDSCASSKGDTEKASIPEGFDVSSTLGWTQTHRQSMTAATTTSKTKHWGRGARRRTKPEPKNFDRRERERRLTGSLPARFISLLNATRGWTGSRKQNHCPLLNSQPSPFVPAPTGPSFRGRAGGAAVSPGD